MATKQSGGSVHTSANLIFQQKGKKEILLILIIFTYFKVQTKIEKKKMDRKIDHFFYFSNFEVRFKNNKKNEKKMEKWNYGKLGDRYAIFLFLHFLNKMEKMKKWFE